MNLRKAFGWSAIESIGSRLFDLVTLWVVMNNLPESDIAMFGVATSAIFIFNFFLLAPETSLFRFQKKWFENGDLPDFVGAFVGFSALKVFVHVVAVLIAFYYLGLGGIFYSIIFSLNTQLIQAAEISRIYHRMNLKQQYVAKVEIGSKFILFIFSLLLIYFGSVFVYFSIFTCWSVIVALFWLIVLVKKVRPGFCCFQYINKIKQAIHGFSLWNHLSGVITLFLYNSNVLFLNYFGNVGDREVALVTVLNKTANLFFVIPMFIQSFIPVFLANSKDQSGGLKKTIVGNSFIAFFQYVFFIFFGKYMGSFFGVSKENVQEYYCLGLWVCGGIFVLNLCRPLSTYLMIKSNPVKVLFFVFIPPMLLALVLFGAGAKFYSTQGVAIACFIVYSFLSFCLLSMYFNYRGDK